MEDSNIIVISPMSEDGHFTNPRLEKIKHPGYFTVFLAGPTERENYEKNWRFKAIDYLKDNDGDVQILVFSPVNTYYNKYKNKEDIHLEQVMWETDALQCCDQIVFWIPRTKELPGLTTNIEIGEWMNDPKTIIGLPDGAEHNQYIKDRLLIYNKSYETDLNNILDDILDKGYTPFPSYDDDDDDD